MEEIFKLIRGAVEAGRRFAKEGLPYEAAYRYGQAAAMIAMLYTQHESGFVVLDDVTQSVLAPLREKLEVMVESLSRSSGNGRHKLSSKESDAKRSLHDVIGMLVEDVRLI
jgi:hypothetical protein